ncbi:MBL fold metallo-hydrolase [Candidatus Vallotia tarda]|nr:MBL fold metallo-hydrolase [Candidatus Vallotia tarda]
MQIKLIPVTTFMQNCSLLVCEHTMRAAIVDPGEDLELIQKQVKKHDARVEKVLLTHGHVDYCAGASALALHYGVPIEGPHPDEKFWLSLLPQQSRLLGLPEAQICVPDRWLYDGDIIRFGNETLEVIHCPGHTPGHVVFLNRDSQLALVGDVLLAGSIGRTDFPCSNHIVLISSIQKKLWPLGDDVRFVPGHGPMSTFGEERRTNPYVTDRVIAS